MLSTEEALDSQYSWNCGVFKLPSPLPKFVPATEQLITLPISASYLMKAVWDEEKPSILRKRPEQAGCAPIRTSPYKTRLRSFAIDSNIYSNITTACREHKTTITGLLHGLALLSLSLGIKETDAMTFKSATPVNLRPLLPLGHPKYPWLVPERTISNFVSLMSHKFSNSVTKQIRSHLKSLPSDGNLSAELLSLTWSVSSRVRKEIELQLKLGPKNDAVGLMKYAPDWWKQLTSLTRKPRQYSWLVPNLGILNGAPNMETSSHRVRDGRSKQPNSP